MARAGLAADGCAVLPDLLRPRGLRGLRDEAWLLTHTTYYTASSINPYFSAADPSLPDDHPVSILTEKSSGLIPGDAWGTGSPTDAVYRWPPLLPFPAEALDVASLHCYANPLACLTVNVLDPGQQFAWHYDTNDFAVTLLLDGADEGGLFKYAPNIRTPTHEPFDEVADVLLGRSDKVRTLELRPGDPQIFRGRYSLHQVPPDPGHATPRSSPAPRTPAGSAGWSAHGSVRTCAPRAPRRGTVTGAPRRPDGLSERCTSEAGQTATAHSGAGETASRSPSAPLGCCTDVAATTVRPGRTIPGTAA